MTTVLTQSELNDWSEAFHKATGGNFQKNKSSWNQRRLNLKEAIRKDQGLYKQHQDLMKQEKIDLIGQNADIHRGALRRPQELETSERKLQKTETVKSLIGVGIIAIVGALGLIFSQNILNNISTVLIVVGVLILVLAGVRIVSYYLVKKQIDEAVLRLPDEAVLTEEELEEIHDSVYKNPEHIELLARLEGLRDSAGELLSVFDTIPDSPYVEDDEAAVANIYHLYNLEWIDPVTTDLLPDFPEAQAQPTTVLDEMRSIYRSKNVDKELEEMTFFLTVLNDMISRASNDEELRNYLTGDSIVDSVNYDRPTYSK